MTPSRRRLLLGAWALLVIGLAVRAFGRGLIGDRRGDRLVLQAATIDLNRGSVAELASLPGIGVARAEAIVLHRIRNGAFRGVEDLARVDGLGAATVASLRPFVVCAPSGAAH